jgi:hypothetical protein
MADQKLTALAAEAAPVSTDILYLVDDPGGAPASRKVTVGNLAGAMYVWQTFTFTYSGDAVVSSGVFRLAAPCTLTIDSVHLTCNTAPTGASIIVDVNKNGVTIFTTQGNRPAIAATAFSGTSAAPDVTGLVANDYLTFDIDQIGSTLPGGNLAVHVRCKQAVAV